MKHLLKTLTRTLPLTLCLSTGLAVAAPTLSFAEAPTPPNTMQPEQRVSLNTADAQTLATQLDGVGPAKAERIVAWREANGRFERAEQLLEVKGIGEATLKKNLNRIAL